MIESNDAGMEPMKNDNHSQDSSDSEKSDSNVIDLKKRIEELEAQLKEKDSKYLYLYAEFDNFRKRSIKERSDLIKFGWESVARELLQTVDNLERALAHTPSGTDKNLMEGLQMVLNQFKSSLQKQGVQTIESLKKTFDPNLHEAVGQEESDLPSGLIVKELAPGYTLHGRLLRPAKVVISSGQSKTKEAASG